MGQTKSSDQHEPREASGRWARIRPPGLPRHGRARWRLAAGVLTGLIVLVTAPAPTAETTAEARAVPSERSTAPFTAPSAGARELPTGDLDGALSAAPAAAESPLIPPGRAAEASALAANGIPAVALNAYRVAAARMNLTRPGCGIDWSLLAGIGRIESNHGRYGGAILGADGTSTPPVRGPALDGGEFARIPDSDDGAYDGDTTFDRAVGPMQFIPTTWRSYAVDGDGDGTADPFDIDDAALAAAHYLCRAGGDLTGEPGQRRAVFAYNHSDAYVAQVLALTRAYAAGVPLDTLPPLSGDTSAPVPPPTGDPTGPASPGPAIGLDPTTSPAEPPAAAPPSTEPVAQAGPAPSSVAAADAPQGSPSPSLSPSSSVLTTREPAPASGGETVTPTLPSTSAAPTCAPLTSTPPTSTPPTSAPPTSTPPTSAPPTSAPSPTPGEPPPSTSVTPAPTLPSGLPSTACD